LQVNRLQPSESDISLRKAKGAVKWGFYGESIEEPGGFHRHESSA
jgi:hypothetical protein